MPKIAVIGGGKIGEALIAGLIAGGVPPKDIHVANRRPERGKELVEAYGIIDFVDHQQATDGTDVVFLCVKPKDTVPVLTDLADFIDNNPQAAGGRRIGGYPGGACHAEHPDAGG